MAKRCPEGKWVGGKKEAAFRAKERGGSKKVGFPTLDSVKFMI